MKKLLSIILAVSMFVSVMTGLTLTVGAGFEDEALALYDFTVADSDYVPAASSTRVSAESYLNPLGFNAYLAMDNNPNNNTATLSYFRNVDNRTPNPQGLSFGLNGGTGKTGDNANKGRVTLTYAIPEASANTETMVYEFSVLGQSDMRATAFGLSTADADTIADEMTDAAVVNPTSNANDAAQSYVSDNRLFLARFSSGGNSPNFFSSASTTRIGNLTGPQMGSNASNGYNGYDVRIEYTPSLAENNLYIAMRTYNNVSTDTPSDEYSTTVTVNVPEGDNPWPEHLFVQTTHGLTGSNNCCDLRYLRIYDKALESQLAVTDVVISAPILAVEKGGSVQLQASVMSGTIVQNSAEVEWELFEAPEGVSISDTGLLSVSKDAAIDFDSIVTVIAKSSEVEGYEFISVLGPKSITVDGNKAVAKNSTETLTAKVFGNYNGTAVELSVLAGVDWSIVTEDTGAKIDEQGTLFVPADTTAEAITVQATSKYNETAFGQYTIEVVPEGTPLYPFIDFEDPASLPEVFDSANITQVDGRDGNVYKIGYDTTQTNGVSFNLDRYATNNTMAKVSFDYMFETFPESATMLTIRDHNENGNPMNIGSVILSDHNAIVEEEYTEATGVFKLANMSGVTTGNWYHFDVYAYPSNDKAGRGIYVEMTGMFNDSDEVQTKSATIYGRRDNNQHYPKVVRVEFSTGFAGGTSPRGDNAMYLDNISVTELKPSVDVEIKGEYELGGSVKATSPAAEISGLVLNSGNNSIPFDFVRGIDVQLTVNKGYQAIVTAEDEEGNTVDPSTAYIIKAADTKGVTTPNYKFTVEFVPTTNYEILSVDEEENTISAVNIKSMLATEEAAKVFVAAYDANGACIEVVSGAITDVNVGDEAKITLAKGLNIESAKTVKAFILANDSLNPLADVPYTVK